MKTISIYDYNESMGKLIDVQHPLDYKKKHDPRSVNIYADKLIMNHKKYLNKTEIYYIICDKGRLSKRVVTTLSYYGYNVVQVTY
ncbi:MAG: rhodanese-like domain-containing protein [Firmicutes bacterium]|nr:rhodanese-like domain-containing protein [Bacillota bacterium]